LKKNWRARAKKIAAVFINTFKISSIQSVMTLSFTCITILTIVFVGLTLYNKFTETAEKNASGSTDQVIDQVGLNLEYYIEGMIEVSNFIDNSLKGGMNIRTEDLNKVFETTYKMRKDIISLALFSDQAKLISGIPSNHLKKSGRIMEQEWFGKAMKEPYTLHVSSPHVQSLYNGRHSWVVSLSRGIFFEYGGKTVQGVTLVDMNFSAIDKLCQRVSLGKRGYIFIVDKEGNLIYHPQQQIVYAGLKNENIQEILQREGGSFTEIQEGEQRLVTIKTVKSSGWKIVGISYVDEIIATKKEINSFVLFIIIFGVVFAISISVFVSARISQPIKRLEKSMLKVEKGDLDICIEAKGEDEVKQLSRSFNLMLARIKQLMEQNVQEQESKRKSELRALQAQINPHFLYNTLDSIVWMAENGKTEGVITMVAALAKLFRISINRGEEIITIRNELEHARNYLTIQEIRYQDKFDWEITADPEVLECKTLKLILQPLIENAIYHGIERTVDKGRIRITASIQDQKVLLQVIDDGLGMSPETLKKVLSSEPKNGGGYGVGVKNVHERIQLYYGKEYGLQILSELDEGTTVNIELPVVEDRDGGVTV
jgi:two-component system, sensor histidine kinase YesM